MIFSRILDRNGRFEIGWYLTVHFCQGSFFVFFLAGVHDRSFQVGWYDTRGQGIVDDVGDCGRRTSRFSYSSSVGLGSRSHDLGAVC